MFPINYVGPIKNLYTVTFVGLDFNTKYQAYLRFQIASYNILRQIESEKDERVKLKTKTQEFSFLN